jgi:hypothetical protein
VAEVAAATAGHAERKIRKAGETRVDCPAQGYAFVVAALRLRLAESGGWSAVCLARDE